MTVLCVARKIQYEEPGSLAAGRPGPAAGAGIAPCGRHWAAHHRGLTRGRVRADTGFGRHDPGAGLRAIGTLELRDQRPGWSAMSLRITASPFNWSPQPAGVEPTVSGTTHLHNLPSDTHCVA